MKEFVMGEFIDYILNHVIVLKLIVSGILLIINILVIKGTTSILFKTIRDSEVYYTTKKKFYYLYTTIFIILILILWSGSKGDITTYMGFISAGIAIALREIFTNIVAWIIILFHKPFEVGDRITINNLTGDVVDIKLFQFVVMEVTSPEFGEQSTGRIVHVPNNYIFTYASVNAHKGFEYIWNEIEVRLTLDSDWRKAKDILNQIINEHTLHLSEDAEVKVAEASKKYMLKYNNLTPIIYTKVREGYIYLTVRYLCEPRMRRVTEDAIWIDVLEQLREEGNIRII